MSGGRGTVDPSVTFYEDRVVDANLHPGTAPIVPPRLAWDDVMVHSLAISPDGTKVASSSGTLFGRHSKLDITDAASGNVIHSPNVNNHSVRC